MVMTPKYGGSTKNLKLLSHRNIRISHSISKMLEEQIISKSGTQIADGSNYSSTKEKIL
jgi:hypothetical protein